MSQSSFDIVSKIDLQEMKNAIMMAQKEMTGRFDFKCTNCQMDLGTDKITLLASDEFKRKNMLDILYGKMVKRGLSIKCLELGPIESAAKGMIRQELKLLQGIPMEKAKEMVKRIKASGIKVQAQIQDQQVRVTGKDKDDLGLALQYTNYRTT